MPGNRLLLAALPILLVTSLWTFGWFWHRHLFGVFGVFPNAYFAGYLFLSYVGVTISYVRLGRNAPLRRTRMFQMVMLTCSLFLCGVLVELPAALKLIDYRAFLGYVEDWNQFLNQVDPELITVHRPNTRLTGKFTGAYVHTLGVPPDRSYEVNVQYDRNGFRNAQNVETADIVLVGDSFVESSLVPLEKIASSHLARELGTSVLNLGHCGFGPQQELITLKRYGLPVRPKLVIWILYEGNDFIDYVNYQRVMASGVEHWAAGWDTFRNRSFSRNMLTCVSQLTRRRALWNARGSGLSTTLKPSGPWQGEQKYFSHNRQLFPVKNTAAVAGTKECIRQAWQVCAENGIEFLLALAPDEFRVYHDLVDVAPDCEIAQWRLTDLPERLAEWTRTDGISYLDLTPMLRKAAAEGALVYFLDDPHWTAEGNTVAGDALAAYCKERVAWTKNGSGCRSAHDRSSTRSADF